MAAHVIEVAMVAKHKIKRTTTRFESEPQCETAFSTGVHRPPSRSNSLYILPSLPIRSNEDAEDILSTRAAEEGLARLIAWSLAWSVARPVARSVARSLARSAEGLLADGLLADGLLKSTRSVLASLGDVRLVCEPLDAYGGASGLRAVANYTTCMRAAAKGTSGMKAVAREQNATEGSSRIRATQKQETRNGLKRVTE